MESKIQKYKNKENYITSYADPAWWSNHANGHIIRRYENKIYGNVLDVGCNHGACTFLLLENPKVENVLGLDLNEQAILVAKNIKKMNFNEKKIDFISVNFLEFNSVSFFDTIVSFHFLEHIYPEDLNDVVLKMKKILTLNGHIIISIPLEKHYDTPGQHVSYFDEESLKKLFVNHGLKCEVCFDDDQCGERGILTAVFKKVSE